MNLEIKPIGIIGAMDNEIELLKSSMEIRMMESIAGMTYYCGTLCGKEVVLVRCGIGKVNAGICAQRGRLPEQRHQHRRHCGLHRCSSARHGLHSSGLR